MAFISLVLVFSVIQVLFFGKYPVRTARVCVYIALFTYTRRTKGASEMEPSLNERERGASFYFIVELEPNPD